MIKSKSGWKEWSNGYINLYYLDDDEVSFHNACIDSNMTLMIRFSVAETDLKTGLMKRTDYGKQLFNRRVRSIDSLTACVREMRL